MTPSTVLPILRRCLAAAALLAVAGTASAQPATSTAAPPAPQPASTPAKKELVARLLKLQQPGVEAMARGLVEQPAVQMLQQAGAVIQQRVPESQREAMAKDIQTEMRKYADDAVPGVQARAVRLAPTTIGTLLEERFSEEELKQLIALMESPVNRRFQSMTGEMQRVLAEKLVADSRADIEPRVRALEQVVAKRLGLPPPGTAASAPARAPAKK